VSTSDALDIDRIGRLESPRLDRQQLDLAPGTVLVGPSGWRDAIVFVVAGEVDVECSSGVGRRFGHGAVLCLARVPGATIRNAGPVPVRLLAIWRRTGHR
jgi:hypothetical protein